MSKVGAVARQIVHPSGQQHASHAELYLFVKAVSIGCSSNRAKTASSWCSDFDANQGKLMLIRFYEQTFKMRIQKNSWFMETHLEFLSKTRPHDIKQVGASVFHLRPADRSGGELIITSAHFTVPTRHAVVHLSPVTPKRFFVLFFFLLRFPLALLQFFLSPVKHQRFDA